MIQSILSSNWIGTLVGAVGIILAIVFYVRTRRRPGLAFQSDEVTLVGGKGAAFPKEVEIRFGGAVVPRITAMRVVVWNSGNQTINSVDLVNADPLRIELPDGAQLLKYELLRTTRTVLGWRTEPAADHASRLLLRFDFLDPGDGMVMEVIHTGALRRHTVAGTVRGIPAGVTNYGRSWSIARRKVALRLTRRAFYVVMFCMGLAATGIAILTPQLAVWLPAVFGPRQPDPGRYQRIDWVLAAMGGLYSLLSASLLWVARRRYPATLDISSPGRDDIERPPNEASHPTPVGEITSRRG